MALRIVQSLSLADQVFEQLGGEILSGRYPPGTYLPAERKLVETFKVNRHVVREALKRLEQMGLVRVSQGGGTSVTDFLHTAGLDLLAMMADHSTVDEQTMKYWLSVHEMRAVTAADAARLCALRATKELKSELVVLARQMADMAEGPELLALDIRFWEKVLDGADNIAYRLAFNSLVRGVTSPAAIEHTQRWGFLELKDCGYRLPIAQAIAAGNDKLAEKKTREAMRGVIDVLLLQVYGAESSEPDAEEADKSAPKPARKATRK